ncbi:glycosyltransferase family 4 protein [Clostridium akagii]|uniref:glycosyltransferase family 4 protein n=1 Tax=Clostridium akagii TaxID=91623 RepID=UPI00047B0BED|nr:glycosyltransferase family 4 protein [Clostridium akagii]
MDNLLIVCDYFYPDIASTGQLLTELCLELQDYFNISVIASVPSLQKDKYQSDINYEKFQNINMYRVKTKYFDKKNKISRIKHVIEYYFSCKNAIKKLEKQNIIFTISQPPILGGLLGLYAKKFHKAKLIYNIQDFNPEQIQAVGYIKSKLLIYLLRKIDIRTCNNADNIIVVGSDMLDTIKKRKIIVDNKISVVNNWIDEKSVYPLSCDKVLEFKKKYNLKNKLVFMYSGNIGLYYDLENIVKVFDKFRYRKDIVFTFVGDGVKKSEIEKYVINNKIDNVIFIPFQNKEDLVYSLNAADVHLVTNKRGIKGVSVPSKIYGVMAVAKYILGIVESGSEASNLIERSDCGLVVEPENYEEIYKAVSYIINMKSDERREKGVNGRRYLENNLTKSKSISKYKEVLFGLSV